ncbi:hypothetical protein CDL15_Pgr010273 [Punica granatum]|uniref:Uncharacterized protein n=1 Tax=Punica granatum TaxID=22663 RepID=A0A218WKW2_PUNGR|nr:hypothetical protein CDL15_Pgr010273 [Punica granatum]
MLPSLDARGKESGKRPWESQDSAWALRVTGPERWQQRQLGENGVGTLAPTTARCKIRLVRLLRGGSRRSWTVSNMPNPGQARNSERKFGKEKGTR